MPSLPKTLPHICVALGFSSASQLSRAADREYKDGNTFLEFRLDYLPEPAAGVEVIRKLRKVFRTRTSWLRAVTRELLDTSEAMSNSRSPF